ncbi:DUF488 domain-containing protein [Azospirillum argentinense]|uniref:DUF488 domain-containing protein n=1 Tax=Azospirillum argentinense TaxID=2970906 RepID=A0A4D8PB14_9PROT|nr:DUF488 domain-containing protein [Azospirillum argentinense]QCN94370.1 DUF488 domain-containing protein [Azospirillum argentinense]
MSSNAPPLYTIGYEGASFDSVLRALKAQGVGVLLDVRELPLSRRAGFSKRPLSAGLEEAGIGYVHLKGLGTPKEGRVAAHQGDLDRFWSIVDAKMQTPEAEHDLNRAAALARERPACLLCFEASPHLCHRLRVGELLHSRFGFTVEHLTPAEPSF